MSKKFTITKLTKIIFQYSFALFKFFIFFHRHFVMDRKIVQYPKQGLRQRMLRQKRFDYVCIKVFKEFENPSPKGIFDFLLRVKSFLHGFLSQLLFLPILELCELFFDIKRQFLIEMTKQWKTYIVILPLLSLLQIVLFRFQSDDGIPQFTSFGPQLIRIQRIHIQRFDPDA